MIKDFKVFLQRGNVIELAVAVIVGGAFGNIVSSLVNDVVMPIFGKVLGNVNFTDLKWVLEPAHGDMSEVAVYYGMFIQNIFDFLIIAFTVFLIIRLFESMKRKKEVVEKVFVDTTAEEILLLRQIRDSLSKDQEA